MADEQGSREEHMKQIQDAQTHRFQTIMARIAQTDRGNALVNWMIDQKINPIFIQAEEGFVHYEDNTQDQNPDSPTGKNMYLNWDMRDDALIVFIFEQMRHAWQDDLDVVKTQNHSVLSNNLNLRFREADKRSYTVAMVLDHARETGGFGLLQMMHNFPEYESTLKFVTHYSVKPNVDFDDYRRFGFDAFFSQERETIFEHEGQWIDDYIDRLKAATSERIRTQVSESIQNKTCNLSLAFNDLEPVKTITVEQLASFGQEGFSSKTEGAKNYLTETNAPYPLSSEFYLQSSPTVAQKIHSYITNDNKLLSHKNLDGSPSSVSAGEIALKFKKQQDARHALQRILEQKEQSEALGLTPQEQVLKAFGQTQEQPKPETQKPAPKKRGWFGRKK